MRAKYLWLIIFLAILLQPACKTVKKSAKTESLINTEQKNVREQLRQQEKTKQEATFKDLTKTDEESETTTTKTNWSKPDTAGKQYPISTETTKTNKKSKQQNNLQANTHNNKEQVNTRTNEDKSNSKTQADNSEENTIQSKSKEPVWLYIVVGTVLLIALTILINRIFNHKNI